MSTAAPLRPEMASSAHPARAAASAMRGANFHGLRAWSAALAGSLLLILTLTWYTVAVASESAAPKLYYVHVPAAIITFGACAAVFVSSLGYLWNRRECWDHVALASARSAVVLCSLLLITGVFWARQAWGAWWVWSPRLTFSLVLWVLYSGYLLIRGGMGRGEKTAVVAAVYGIIAFLDVPLVWLSVKLLPDIHPEAVQVRPHMQQLLMAWMGALVLVSVAMTGFWYAWLRRDRGAEGSAA
jgi:heme exporter protein C